MDNQLPVVFNEQDSGLIKQQDNTMLNEIMRVEIDTAISTAKRYPRNLTEFKRKALSMATLDQETAESCFYTLPRAGKVIEGPSIRLAEIITSAWGNLRVYANVIANDRKAITARAYCHDLENNVAIGIENKRRITGKDGRTFTEDMQVVTGNAACKIALRNAVFSVIPMAYTKDIYLQVKKVAAGDISTLKERREKALRHFKELHVGYDRIYSVLDIKSDEDIDQDKLLILIGIANAVKDGDTTLEEAFPKLTSEKTDTQIKSETALKDTMEKIKDTKINGGGSNGNRKEYRR